MKRFKVTPGFVCLCCFLGWYRWQLLGAFLLCAAIHEAAHLLALRLCRVPVYGVELGAGGAVMHTGLSTYGRELLCAAAGPACSLLAAAITLRSHPSFAVLNGLLAAGNLLPIYPLDGGRMLRAALLLRLEPQRAAAVVRKTAGITLCLLMVLACWMTVSLQAGLWPVFAALVVLRRAGRWCDL